MTFGEGSANPAFPLSEAAKKLVMHAEIEIGGTTVMFSDAPPPVKLVQGDAISLIVQSRNAEDLERWHEGLQRGPPYAWSWGRSSGRSSTPT